MKKLILLLTISTLLCGKGLAQDNAPMPPGPPETKMTPEEKGKLEADKAEKKLGLTTDQKIKWETAARERAAANQLTHQKLRGSTTPEERRKMHGDLKAENQKFDATVAAILNPEQKTKYDTWKVEQREKREDRMERRGGKQPLKGN